MLILSLKNSLDYPIKPVRSAQLWTTVNVNSTKGIQAISLKQRIQANEMCAMLLTTRPPGDMDSELVQHKACQRNIHRGLIILSLSVKLSRCDIAWNIQQIKM